MSARSHFLRPSRAAVWNGVRVAGLTTCIAVLAFRLDSESWWASLTMVPAETIAWAGITWVVGMLFRCTKWAIQVRALGLEFDTKSLIQAQLWGVLAGVVTPLRLGEAYRLSGIRLHGTGQASLAGMAIFYEKIVEAHLLLCLVAVGVFVFFDQPGIAMALGAVVCLTGLLAYGTVNLPNAVSRVARPLAMLQSARDALSVRGRVAVVVLTALSHAFNFIGGASMYRAMGDIGWEALCFGLPTITFSSAIPFTISGIGVRELVAIEVFRGSSIPPESLAMAASLSFVGANILPTVILLPLLGAWSLLFPDKG